jgi:Galactose oxidase, central domain
MTYVPATRTIVLFGGANLAGGDGGFSDTWTWDGIAKTWTQQNPTTHPSAPTTNQLVYDEATSTVVLFGGVTTNLTDLDDTWTWDGTNWTQQFPSSSSSPRNSPAMAYDPGLRAVVLFGGAVGTCCSDNLNDTWTWNGVNWTEIHPANTLPHGRNSAGMTYDPAYKALLLFGGQAAEPLGDTWLLALAP